MKNLITSIWMLFIAFTVTAQQEVKVSSTIEEVTVFVNAAQIQRSGSVSLPKGESTLILMGLSPHIHENSIRIKTNAQVSIQGVSHELDHLSTLENNKEVNELEAALKSINAQIKANQAQLEVLIQKENLLMANQQLGGTSTGLNLSQLEQAMAFFEKQLRSIKTEAIKINESNEQLSINRNQLQQELNQLQANLQLPSGMVKIRVKAASAINTAIGLSYLVDHAGWYPKYDLRTADISEPLNLLYKAEVYQNTGVNWDKVKLSFSSGNPDESGVLPDLMSWKLDFARYGSTAIVRGIGTVSGLVTDERGMPLPGVIVRVQGTSLASTTNYEGNYSLTIPSKAQNLEFHFIGYQTAYKPINSPIINLQMSPDNQALQEVVQVSLRGKVSGINISNSDFEVAQEPARGIATAVENPTTVKFSVDEPYSVPSQGGTVSVDLNEYHLPAEYEYLSVPKLGPEAFLSARITDWDKLHLLEGEAFLYFGDSFVGKSIINPKNESDTLALSLGKDPSIQIDRIITEEYSDKKIIGGNKTDYRTIEITVKNTKSKEASVMIQDQIPLALRNTIEVEALETSGGQLDPATGIVSWRMKLAPQQSSKIVLSYSVKYPKNEKVKLD